MAPQGTEQRVADRYLLKDSLGSGGMGVVWRAHDELLQRDVAIKEVRFPPGLHEEQREAISERVMREARTAARLNHPNAVGVFDVIKGDGRAFIVMELIDAPTLADVVREERFTPQKVAEVGLQILSALEAAHAQGIVHRDVKPANVMFPKDAPAKLADFGIASVKGDPRLTASGMILGSPSFMSPEQAREGDATAASDIWALGATLYLAAEGKPPFDKGQPIPTLTSVLTDDPAFTERSGELRAAVEACLQKDPAARPSAEQLREMLTRVASGEVTTEAIAEPEETLPEPEPVVERTSTRPPRQKTDRSPWLWLLGLAALVLVVGVLVAVNASKEREPQERAGNAAQGQQQGNDDDTGTAEAPEGWTQYEDPTTGYSIAYPEGWSIEEGRGTSQSVDFVDPDSGAYMRVDWTDTPGDSAQAAWEAQEPDFESSHANYERITMEETTFQDYEASHWEYTWGDDVTYHAVNLGFVTGDYGFALNYQAPESSWADLQDDFEQIRDSFVAP